MEINKFSNIYDEVFETVGDIDGEVIATHINKLKELDTLIPPSAMFFCVTNTTKHTFEYVSKNFFHATGLDPIKMKTMGMSFWWSRMHPEEQQIWLKALADLMKFTLQDIKFEDRAKVSYIWNYSIANSKDEYLNVTQHTTPMYFDEDGKPVIGLAHYSVTGKDGRLPIKATALKLNENDEYETIYFKNHSQKLIENHYSNRERDVLRLVARGFDNKEIASNLFLSEHTINTHRRNILSKSKCKNFTELIANCVKEGLI